MRLSNSVARKGSLPQKATNCTEIGISSFSGGDTCKLCAQTKFEAKRLKIAPFNRFISMNFYLFKTCTGNCRKYSIGQIERRIVNPS